MVVLTVAARVEQVFAQVAAEDALLENARLLQFSPRWSRKDETPAYPTHSLLIIYSHFHQRWTEGFNAPCHWADLNDGNDNHDVTITRTSKSKLMLPLHRVAIIYYSLSHS